jgi:tetratricopeptide (TPR) repeat protein
LQPLLEAPDQRAGALATVGDIARAEGDYRQAVSAYRQSLDIEFEQPRVIEAMAWCLTRMGLMREAIGGYRAYLERVPGDLDARRALAQLLAESGDAAGAAESFQAAIASGGDDAATRQSLAATLEMAGQLDAAEQQAERVLGENPALPGAQLVRARAYLRRGQADFALGTLDPLPDPQTNPQARRFVQMLRGRAYDLKGDPAAAVAAWREAHALAGATGLPPLERLDGLEAAVATCAEAGQGYATRGPAALLLGAPGSCVELIAALLSDSPGLVVLNDRFGDQPRGDLFTRPELGRYREPLRDEDARIIGRHYERPLLRQHPPSDRRLIEWLPHWDANFLPAVHRVFGPIPLIVAGRDPRDALLQWLALGSPHRLSAADPVAAATWLGTAYEHLLWTRDHGRLPVIGVDAISLLEDPAAAAHRIAGALDLDALSPGPLFERARLGPGRHEHGAAARPLP